MRQDYIREEVKKGNPDAKIKAPKIDMLPPLSKEDALSIIGKRERDRSRSKSPETRNYASDRKQAVRSRLDLFAENESHSNDSRLLYNPPGGFEQHQLLERNQPSMLSEQQREIKKQQDIYVNDMND
jgi:hypothetical protein